MTTKRTPFAAAERRVPGDPARPAVPTARGGDTGGSAGGIPPAPAIGGRRTLEEVERLARAASGRTEDDGT